MEPVFRCLWTSLPPLLATKFIYGPDSRVATLIEKNNTLYKVIYEPGLDSVRYIFNLQTKEVVQEIEYDEFGNQTKNTNPTFQPLGFAGGLYDSDTKLIRFGARDYDPTVGRWTTKDPIGFAGGDTNLYAYVNGDPMGLTDPEGESALGLLAVGIATLVVSYEVLLHQTDPLHTPKRQLQINEAIKSIKGEKPEQCPKYMPAEPQNLPTRKSPGDMRKRKARA